MKKLNAKYAKFKEELSDVQSDIENGNYERAVNNLEELIRTYPNNAEPYYEFGNLCLIMLLNEEAEDYFQKAIKVDATYFPSYIQLGFLLIKEERYDEAKEILNASKKLKISDRSDEYLYEGIIHQQQGELEAAMSSFTKAVQFSLNESQMETCLNFLQTSIELISIRKNVTS